jgi:hypothetical protein
VIDVVCWKWRPPRGYRSQFGPQTVNTLARMVKRHLTVPHRFSCITDDPAGIDSSIRIIPLWDDFASVPNPSNGANPSCYRRLRMFAPDAAEIIGERIVSLDLDMVLVGDVTPLFDRAEDFVIWGGQSVQPKNRGAVYNWYNGSFMVLRAGTRPQVWTDFDPATSPRRAHEANCRGSDQGWIAYRLGKKEAIVGESDGVYSYRNHILPSGRLPKNARMVAFHGRFDPWHTTIAARHDWIRTHYR